MKLKELMLSGAYVIEPKKDKDVACGTLEVFSAEEYSKHGLETGFKRMHHFHVPQKATVHGLTYQLEPMAENRLFWCTHGSLYSVIIDLRAGSPTFEVFYGIELKGAHWQMMYIPKGFAHGFLTLEDDTEAMGLASAPFSKEHVRGIRFNDRKFRIQWPTNPRSMNLQDRRYPDYDPASHLGPQ